MNNETLTQLREERNRIKTLLRGWENAIKNLPPETVEEFAHVVNLRSSWMEKDGLLELDLLGEELKNGR